MQPSIDAPPAPSRDATAAQHLRGAPRSGQFNEHALNRARRGTGLPFPRRGAKPIKMAVPASHIPAFSLTR
jgi:hypothetical protein